MRLIESIDAARLTATYRAAAFVGLVSEGALLPAYGYAGTVGVRPALAQSAIVLVHEEAALAMKIALEFRASRFVVGYDVVVGVCRDNSPGYGVLATANRTSTLVPPEHTVQVAVRQLRASLRVLLVVFPLDALASATAGCIGDVTVATVQLAVIQRAASCVGGYRRASRATLAGSRGRRVVAVLAHGRDAGRAAVGASATDARAVLPILPGHPQRAVVVVATSGYLRVLGAYPRDAL